MKASHALSTVAVVMVIGISVLYQPAAGQNGYQEGETRLVALNFADSIDLQVLAKWISEVTGRAFVYDETFQGAVSLQTPEELPESALMPLFESVLKLKGYAMVPRGDLVLIVKNAVAPALDTSMVFPSEELRGQPGAFINQIVALRYADPQSVAAAIRPFLSAPNSVLVIDEQNKLAISDYTDNVVRALEIVAHLDQKAARPQVVLMPLDHARATEVASQLDIAFAKEQRAQAGPAALPIFKADQRTNSVLVVTTENDLPAIDRIVKTLDVEAAEPERPMQIHRLRNTKAESMLATIGELIQGVSLPTEAGQPERAEIQVVADQASNSLIVAATKADHEWIGKLISDLDERRPQVLLEAWIVVVNERGAEDLGVELSAKRSGGTFFGITEFDRITGTRLLPQRPGPGVTAAIVKPDDVAGILRALEQEQKAMILSRPRLLANDNEEATFHSVTEEPFVTISAITASTSTTSFGGFEKAGTMLTITPTIYDEGYLFLDISLTVSSFIGPPPAPETPPPREENKIETGVTVPNQATIVIGGIMRSDDVESVDKVPLLGDIPLLGLLFRRTITSTVQNTIYAFIRPHILWAEDFSDLKDLSAESEEALERLQWTDENGRRPTDDASE